MIGVDTNILVHAHRQDASMHVRCAKAIRGLAEGRAPWALPWPCVHEFLAIVTHPRIFDPPSPLPVALDQVDAWLESPSVILLSESADHWHRLRTALEIGQVTGARVHDARVAAVCAAHGVRTLWTFDRDFTRWGGLVATEPPA